MVESADVGASASTPSLFQVYLRLRPPPGLVSSNHRFITVEPPATDAPSTAPTHITLNPPSDRRRAIEKFAFTQVFEEDASQLDVFHCTNILPLVEGVLAPFGGDGTDALLATLGVTGSGKSHTILGSQSQRGLTQLALDVLFRSIGDNIADIDASQTLESSIKGADVSEANISSALAFIEAVYGDSCSQSRPPSRTQYSQTGDQTVPPTPRRHLTRPSALPQVPDLSTVSVPCDPAAEYVVLVSMYEVYNDRIFDLLTSPVQSAATKEFRRRSLLFKSTELSPDRKVVAGLRKIVCSSLTHALMIIEAGLHERRVAGTSSNSTSSRSHGFFSIEVKKRKMSNSKRFSYPWTGNALTIVDLAGSERARDAKTAGSTLAEAGKINESLMYLGQCLQMQSDIGSNIKSNVVPFRQCKLTELLFSNSFPSASAHSQSQTVRRNPQKGVMIVTADPHGDYNATSQILRYSALAREIAVPRIPSLTKTILNEAYTHQSGPDSCGSLSPVVSPTHGLHHRPFLLPGKHSQRNFSPVSAISSEDRVTMEHAALEITRLAEQNRCLHENLEREQDGRLTAEAHLLSIQDRMIDLEQAVREDCVAEFEQRLMVELSRWKEARQTAIERGEEHWDRKMEVYQRSMALQSSIAGAGHGHGGEDEKENTLIESLEEENERLRREVMILKRELAGRSPSKRMPLLDREDFMASANGSPRSARSRTKNKNVCYENDQSDMMHRRLEDLTLGSTNSSRASSMSRGDGAATSMKKVRKLPTRKWEGGLEGMDDPF